MRTSTLKWTIVTCIVLGTVGFAMAENRKPTKGRIPDAAFEGDRINVDKVPDYFPVYARNGEIAGYIRKTDHFVSSDRRPRRIVVVDETLTRAVGHMVVNRGFVPLGVRDEAVPEFEVQALTSEEVEEASEDSPAQD
jgi:hypothetical protein